MLRCKTESIQIDYDQLPSKFTHKQDMFLNVALSYRQRQINKYRPLRYASEVIRFTIFQGFPYICHRIWNRPTFDSSWERSKEQICIDIGAILTWFFEINWTFHLYIQYANSRHYEAGFCERITRKRWICGAWLLAFITVTVWYLFIAISRKMTTNNF